jgi:hypothetical protein
MVVEFVVECPSCDGEASAGNTLFTTYEEGKPLQIDLGLSASQMTFTCNDCGERCYSGDFEVSTD